MTALSEKMSESVRSFGFEILINMQPTMKASISVPKRHCITSNKIASGHSSVIERRPKPWKQMYSNKSRVKGLLIDLETD